MTDPLDDAPATLQEALRRAATDHPSRGIGLFDSRGRRLERRTYTELYESARAAAARFAALGLGRHEPMLVAMPTSWDWMEGWFGALLAGAWPTAISPGGALGSTELHLAKIGSVMDRIGARYAYVTDAFKAQAAKAGHRLAGNTALTPADLATVSPASGVRPAPGDPDDTAFLQLTSGSTGFSRAVMISHRAAIHNPLASCEAIGAPFGAPAHDWADAMVAWLPLYHDMGLIGCLTLPILTGLDLWLLRPETFLARPRLWLENLTGRGITFAPAPNFAYQLCVERIRDRDLEGLNLSSWRAALVGAETVRSESARAFCDRFAVVGFDPRAMRPCYGLAEATLAVTFDVKGQGVRTLPAPAGTDAGVAVSDVVSTGAPIRDTEVRIAAPSGDPLPEGTIGEVWIRGPGVFSGYYLDEVATAAALRDGWHLSGDLGFLQNGELYLTGRSKDVLILRGHNIMPDELERIADAVTGGGGLQRSGAFSVARGVAGEEPVVVMEVSDVDSAAVKAMDREVRVRIGRALSLPLADLVMVRRGRIPRTTSGKVQRHELRRRYLEGELERLR